MLTWIIICITFLACGLFFGVFPYTVEIHVSSSLHDCMSQAIFNTMNKTVFDECDTPPKLWIYLFALHVLSLTFLSLSSIIALLKHYSK